MPAAARGEGGSGTEREVVVRSNIKVDGPPQRHDTTTTTDGQTGDRSDASRVSCQATKVSLSLFLSKIRVSTRDRTTKRESKRSRRAKKMLRTPAVAIDDSSRSP